MYACMYNIFFFLRIYLKQTLQHKLQPATGITDNKVWLYVWMLVNCLVISQQNKIKKKKTMYNYYRLYPE